MAAENILRYVSVDYLSHKNALLQRVRSRWSTVWNDFTANSLAMMFVDLVAWSTSTLAFLINRAAAENFVTTMTLRESAIRLGSLVGYQLRGPVPATVLCEATLQSSVSQDVKIAKGTLVRSGSGLPFEVAQDYAILAGTTSPKIEVLTMSPTQSGAKFLSSAVSVTNGLGYVDAVDTAVDLRRYVAFGQTFSVPLDQTDSTIYTIQSIESSTGASGYNRLVITPNFAGTSNIAAVGTVFDRRILLVQGQTLVDRFITPGNESPGFSVKLSRGPVIDRSVSVLVNGEPWSFVVSTSVESASSKVFEIRVLPSGTTLVQFGDGMFGTSVPTDASVVVIYRIGGGEDGNVTIGSIGTSITGLVSGISTPVMIGLTNSTSPGQGGRSQESLEEARVNIPFHARTNDRAVTLDDWQTLAQGFSDPKFGAVAYARASVRTENSLLEGNLVIIYAWMTGPAEVLVPLSPSLKIILQEFLRTKAVGTDYALVFDGSDRPAPISLRIKVFDGFDASATKSLVQDLLRQFVTNLRPGQPVVYSDLVRAVDEVSGVDSVQMATPISDIVVSNPTELFTPPRQDFDYNLTLSDVGGNIRTAQSPVTPLQAWAFKMTLTGVDLLVLPHKVPGFARLIGSGLSTGHTDVSNINLLTGQVRLVLAAGVVPGSLKLRLIPVQVFDRERPVDVFVGYVGTNTPEKRAEIRAALRAWAEGMGVGAAIYAGNVQAPATSFGLSGISTSMSNVASVVAAIGGVASVARVALGTPASNEDRIVAADSELLRLGSIILNNNAN